MPYEQFTIWPRFAEYVMDEAGMISPAPGATHERYEPFASFTPGAKGREISYQPPYRPFMALPEADDDAVLDWVNRNGLLGVGDPSYGWGPEPASQIREEARAFRELAQKASEPGRKVGERDGQTLYAGGPSTDAYNALFDILTGHRYDLGAHLVPRISFAAGLPRWDTGVWTSTLIEALYAMLLLDLAGGQEIRRCECGLEFVTSADSRREYCPPEPYESESRCYLRFKKRRQRDRAKAKGGEAATNDTGKATRKKGGTK